MHVVYKNLFQLLKLCSLPVSWTLLSSNYLHFAYFYVQQNPTPNRPATHTFCNANPPWWFPTRGWPPGMEIVWSFLGSILNQINKKHSNWIECGVALLRDDVIKWKRFPRYWPFVRGIHRSPVNSPHKGQWRGALMLSLICAWINSWVNNGDAGVLRRNRAHYDVTLTWNK